MDSIIKLFQIMAFAKNKSIRDVIIETLGISQSAYYRMANKADLKVSEIAAIAEALNCEVEIIITDRDNSRVESMKIN